MRVDKKDSTHLELSELRPVFGAYSHTVTLYSGMQTVLNRL